jgi:signal peptidase I
LRNKRTVALVVLATVLAAGGAAFLFARLFLIKTSRVPSGAMKNTILPGDHILSFNCLERPTVAASLFSSTRVARMR